MIALKTDISDSIDTAPSEVEVMATQTINEVCTTYVQYTYGHLQFSFEKRTQLGNWMHISKRNI